MCLAPKFFWTAARGAAWAGAGPAAAGLDVSVPVWVVLGTPSVEESGNVPGTLVSVDWVEVGGASE